MNQNEHNLSKQLLHVLSFLHIYLRILVFNTISISDYVRIVSSNTMDATKGAGTAQPSGAHVVISGFEWESYCSIFSYGTSVILNIISPFLSFCPFSFGHCIDLWFLVTSVVSLSFLYKWLSLSYEHVATTCNWTINYFPMKHILMTTKND